MRKAVTLVGQQLERLGEHGARPADAPQLTDERGIDHAATPSADSKTS